MESDRMTIRSGTDRRSVLAGLTALPLAGCAMRSAGNGTASAPLTVATYNIWHDRPDWPVRLGLLVETLRAADPDVIALQEVLQDAAKDLPNQAVTLAAALGYPHVQFVATEPEGALKRYGNAILSRLPVLDVARRNLAPLEDHRTAIRVRVQTAAGPVDVVGTHLAWKADQGAVRAEQLADLAGWLPADGVPTIVMGDFNAALDEPALTGFAGTRYLSALPAAATETTLNPARGHANPRIIDHIFVERAAFDIAGARIIGDRPTGDEYPSDHFGVVATLRVR